MSKSFSSEVYIDTPSKNISLEQILDAFAARGWWSHGDNWWPDGTNLPFIYSISDSDLTDEGEAISILEIKRIIRTMQKRLLHHKQFLITLSSQSHGGAISLAFLFENSILKICCFYSCTMPERAPGVVDFNALADILLLPLQDLRLSILGFSVGWS
jgi:hypothetical protein